jgi:hypothetical protein
MTRPFARCIAPATTAAMSAAPSWWPCTSWPSWATSPPNCCREAHPAKNITSLTSIARDTYDHSS